MVIVTLLSPPLSFSGKHSHATITLAHHTPLQPGYHHALRNFVVSSIARRELVPLPGSPRFGCGVWGLDLQGDFGDQNTQAPTSPHTSSTLLRASGIQKMKSHSERRFHRNSAQSGRQDRSRHRSVLPPPHEAPSPPGLREGWQS